MPDLLAMSLSSEVLFQRIVSIMSRYFCASSSYVSAAHYGTNQHAENQVSGIIGLTALPR